MNEPSAGVEWKSNYLCYKKRGDIEPAIEWSYDGISYIIHKIA